MHRLLDRVKLWQRFALLGAMCALLVSPPLWYFLTEINKAIRFTSMELSGIAPGRKALEALQAVQQHRGLSAGFLGADQLKDERMAKQDETSRMLARLQDDLKGDYAPAGANLTRLRSAWIAVAGDVTARAITAQQSYDRHTAICEEMLLLVEQVADVSRLSLDPDADIYHLMRATFFDLPRLAEDLGQVRAKGAVLLANHHIDAESRTIMFALVARASIANDTVLRTFDKAFAVNPGLTIRLADPVLSGGGQARAAAELARTRVAAAETLDFAPPDYIASFTTSINAQFRPIDAALAELNTLLLNRLREQKAERDRAVWSTAALVASFMMAAWLVFRHLERQLGAEPKQLIEALARAARGDHDLGLPAQRGRRPSVAGSIMRLLDRESRPPDKAKD